MTGHRGADGASRGGEPPGYEDPEHGWLPLTAEDQSCAFCGAPPVWLHPLARDKVGFRVYGKGHTLPTFWTVCDRCERLYAAGADAELAELMMRSSELVPARSAVDASAVRVFRRSDTGARPLTA